MVEQIIQDIKQQGWSYLEGVLDASFLSTLSILYADNFVPAMVGKASERQRMEEIRGDLTFWLDPLNPPSQLRELIHLLNELKQHLNQHLYLGLKDFECHLAKYPIGSFYKKHLDRFEIDASRSLSFIFYLHEEWNDKDGGELILYNQKHEIIKKILPKPGSFIIFLSEEFPHEVKPCFRERRSLTGWMHTKILN